MKLTHNQKAMVTVLLAGTLLAVLNQTLLTPALPTVMAHLSISATTAQWLTSGYSLVEAVTIPLNAYLIGRFSTRRLYIGSITLFALGSVACACAPSFPFLMAGRIMQPWPRAWPCPPCSRSSCSSSPGSRAARRWA